MLNNVLPIDLLFDMHFPYNKFNAISYCPQTLNLTHYFRKLQLSVVLKLRSEWGFGGYSAKLFGF
jgi:hypothetical protein